MYAIISRSEHIRGVNSGKPATRKTETHLDAHCRSVWSDMHATAAPCRCSRVRRRARACTWARPMHSPGCASRVTVVEHESAARTTHTAYTTNNETETENRIILCNTLMRVRFSLREIIYIYEKTCSFCANFFSLCYACYIITPNNFKGHFHAIADSLFLLLSFSLSKSDCNIIIMVLICHIKCVICARITQYALWYSSVFE